MKIIASFLFVLLSFNSIAQLSINRKIDHEKSYFNIDGTSAFGNIRLDSICRHYEFNGEELSSLYLINEYVDNRIDNLLIKFNRELKFTYSDEYIRYIDESSGERIRYTIENNLLKEERITKEGPSSGRIKTHSYEYNEYDDIVKVCTDFSADSNAGSVNYSNYSYYYYNQEGNLDSISCGNRYSSPVVKETFKYDQNRLVEVNSFEGNELQSSEIFDYTDFPDSIYHQKFFFFSNEPPRLVISEYYKLNIHGLISEAWTSQPGSYEDRIKYYYSGKSLSEVDELNKQEMELYPNPSNGLVEIKNNPNYTKPLSIKIFNFSGELLFVKEVNGYNSEIYVPNLHGLFL